MDGLDFERVAFDAEFSHFLPGTIHLPFSFNTTASSLYYYLQLQLLDVHGFIKLFIYVFVVVSTGLSGGDDVLNKVIVILLHFFSGLSHPLKTPQSPVEKVLKPTAASPSKTAYSPMSTSERRPNSPPTQRHHHTHHHIHNLYQPPYPYPGKVALIVYCRVHIPESL